MATGGYSCELVPDVPSNCKCPICEKIFRDPHRVSCCEEEYCKACIEESLKDDSCCPKCGHKNNVSISEGKKTRRQVDQLRCHCTNQGEGCMWEGGLQDLDAHVT